MNGPFQEPKSFTAVACGTERIKLRPETIAARRAVARARLQEFIWAMVIGMAVFVFAMGPGFYWRHGHWFWELGAW